MSMQKVRLTEGPDPYQHRMECWDGWVDLSGVSHFMARDNCLEVVLHNGQKLFVMETPERFNELLNLGH